MARTNPPEVAALVSEHGAYLSYPQASELTTVSIRTLKRLSESGELPCYRVGRTRVYRVKTADVLALFERVDGHATTTSKQVGR